MSEKLVQLKKKGGGTKLVYEEAVKTSYNCGATRTYSLTKGIYMVGISNGGASGSNYGTNTVSIASGEATIINESVTNVLSTTDSSYCAWSGLRMALVEVTGDTASINLYSAQGNHSTGQCNIIVKIA